MAKTQVYLTKEELDALRKLAIRSGRTVSEVVRDAIRRVLVKPDNKRLIAIWDGKPRRTSVQHDGIYDEV